MWYNGIYKIYKEVLLRVQIDLLHFLNLSPVWLTLTLLSVFRTDQRDGNVFVRQPVFPPGIIREVQDSAISLDLAVHLRRKAPSTLNTLQLENKSPKCTPAPTNTQNRLRVAWKHGLAESLDDNLLFKTIKSKTARAVIVRHQLTRDDDAKGYLQVRSCI